MIELAGLQQVHEPYVKHLEGPLWEMRMKGKSGIARAVYIAVIGRRVVILRVFTKKTQKIPRREIELALKRAKEVL
ncbi:type II toxin-antitoxin system RelE/ParE family toxin [Phyllobacterium sp. K27]